MGNQQKWSQKYDRCTKCGGTHSRHSGLGLCHKCYMEEYNKHTRGEKNQLAMLRAERKQGRTKITTWAMDFDCCIECGRSNAPHAGHGLCRGCYQKKYDKAYRHQQLNTSKKGKTLKRCTLCGKKCWMSPGQAFCPECRNSELVRFYDSLPRGSLTL